MWVDFVCGKPKVLITASKIQPTKTEKAIFWTNWPKPASSVECAWACIFIRATIPGAPTWAVAEKQKIRLNRKPITRFFECNGKKSFRDTEIRFTKSGTMADWLFLLKIL